MNDVYLSDKDIQILFQKYPVIGKGSEGTLFYVNGVVYKIYHNYEDTLNVQAENIYDKYGVNITKVSDLKVSDRKKNILQYIDSDGVKLFKSEALKRAIQMKDKIRLSFLPQGIIYVNNKVRGCVLKYHSFSTNIYNIRFFPRRVRLQIFKKILLKVEELTQHNIYHLDLCQKPTLESKNTNILFQWNFEPQIVDLEGNSTVYTEFFSQKLLDKVELGLGILFFELLSKEDIEEDFLDTDEDVMSEILLKNEFQDEVIEDFYKGNFPFSKMHSSIEKMSRKLK